MKPTWRELTAGVPDAVRATTRTRQRPRRARTAARVARAAHGRTLALRVCQRRAAPTWRCTSTTTRVRPRSDRGIRPCTVTRGRPLVVTFGAASRVSVAVGPDTRRTVAVAVADSPWAS